MDTENILSIALRSSSFPRELGLAKTEMDPNARTIGSVRADFTPTDAPPPAKHPLPSSPLVHALLAAL